MKSVCLSASLRKAWLHQVLCVFNLYDWMPLALVRLVLLMDIGAEDARQESLACG
jgi:hypothetical protein